MDQRAIAELTVDLPNPPDFIQSAPGKDFLAGNGTINSESTKAALGYIPFLLGIALFGAFLYMNNTDVEMSGLVFGLTAIGGFVCLLIGSVLAYTTAMTKPVIRTATHVIPGVVSKKKFMRKVGMWEIKAEFMSPQSQSTKKAMFILPAGQQGAVQVGDTTVAIVYSSEHDQGVVL